MKLSPMQIAQVAYNAGFRGGALVTAVMVALAESGGDTMAYNPETAAGTPAGSGSRGLWQIYGKAHPEYNSDSVYDPQKNANAAFAIYKQAGNSWNPWSSFKNGSFSQYLQQASQGVAALLASQSLGNIIPGGQNIIGNGGISLPNPFQGVTDALNYIGPTLDWFSNPGRLFKLGVGVSIILLAILLLVVGDVAGETQKIVAGNSPAKKIVSVASEALA